MEEEMDTGIYLCKRIEDQRAVGRALQNVGFLVVLQVEDTRNRVPAPVTTRSFMLCLDPGYLRRIAANFSRFAHPL
jgi:hypothetical protein